MPIIRRKKTEEAKPAEKLDFGKLVKFRLDAEHERVQRSQDGTRVPVMVTVAPADVDLGKQRLGLDVVMVIDISGSMGGEKIKLVVETLLFIIDEMQETDRLALVAFDNVSEILTSLTPMTAENRDKFKKVVVTRIKSRGDTNIDKGLTDGFELLLNRREVNDVTAMFLLSDGQDTCGNSAESIKASLVRLDAQMAKKGMPYKVNSFGYGEGHDEKVLAMIANFREGNFYYIKSLALVDECFIDCMGYLMSIFGTQAEVSFFVDGKATICKKYGASWTEDAHPAKATLRVGNLAVGKERNYILELLVPTPGDATSLRVATAILNFVADKSNFMLNTELQLQVVDGSELGPKNEKVVQNVVRESAAETLKQAEEDFKKGNIVQAKARVQTFKKELRSKDVAEEECDRIDQLIDDDIFDKQKDMHENMEILAAQAYRPAKACYSSSNQMQERFLAKRK